MDNVIPPPFSRIAGRTDFDPQLYGTLLNFGAGRATLSTDGHAFRFSKKSLTTEAFLIRTPFDGQTTRIFRVGGVVHPSLRVAL